ncbi:MAG TPA: GNAT family N-acyltransferase [Pseudonocardiaceae bacterium]|jgi:putative hemolysin|nr:GNAT family N-acyltransferase [Pseudonocardiaceae bacterium]
MSTLSLSVSTSGSVGSAQYTLLVARQQADVRAAQQLRYRVFAGEMGAVLRTAESGLDIDSYDAHCDHLVVRDDCTGEIVGTYRMLPPEGARRAGGLYCETEFLISSLRGLRKSLVETGRSCVHPDHRTGAVVNLIWAGIARYLLLTGYRWLVGCASVPLRSPGCPDGALASGVWDIVRTGHLAPERYRVLPRRPWDVELAPLPAGGSVPPLLRGYLRLGAWVCGPPAHDRDFGVADFLVLLALDRVHPRYLRHFVGRSMGGDA